MQNIVKVLFTGYCRKDEVDENEIRANCTCTLIRTCSGNNIIVDTMTAWDGPSLCEALRNENLEPSDIHFVICTHGHSDHTGCNYLFTQSKWHIVGNTMSNKDRYRNLVSAEASEISIIDKDVTITPTKGHTLSCVSVIVRNSNLGKNVGICGDLFERQEDLFDDSIWLEAGSEDSAAQRQNRIRMIETCDHILPGHGHGFDVTEILRTKFREYNSKEK